jgi:5-oxoprolinase (ATP-hydrolysing) subunit A
MLIDLNCDMGELEDAAYEAGLMEFVTSASIACGGHAGDEATMERTARLALERGVRVGAHPSFPDRANFGRIEMALSPADLEREIFRQILRLDAVVRRVGGVVKYVKAHGALYNLAAKNRVAARAIGCAVAHWDPGAAVFGLAGSPALDLWKEMGLQVAAEGFADRRYEADGSLRSRKLPDALITAPDEAAAQAARLAREGRAQTICVHGDTPGAPAILKACRSALTYEQ